MRTLIYKRTHVGDPDPATGEFGARDCMGRVRDWPFEAVIGVGGTGREAQTWGIAQKLTWIGIGPHRKATPALFHGRSLVTFDHFWDYGKNGPLLGELAPKLAARLYGRNVRAVMDQVSDEERGEVRRILELAYDAPPSPSRGAREGRTRSAHEKSSTPPVRSSVASSCFCRRQFSRTPRL